MVSLSSCVIDDVQYEFFLSRSHFHLHDKSIITQLMQLAMGLVANLGLRRLPPKEPPQLMMDLDSRGCPRPFDPSARTMEERRAGLWCWFVNST